MSSKVPVVRQISWISLVPILLIMLIIMLIYYQFTKTNFALYGWFTFIIFSLFLKRIISKDHRKGMAKIRLEKYEEAIPYFESSYEFFKKNNWIDKYRCVTLLSAGKMAYKEMALNNIAFCYGQTGNGKLSKEYYERTLREYPTNGMAKAGLKLLTAISKDE